jgi:hypothetical protein
MRLPKIAHIKKTWLGIGAVTMIATIGLVSALSAGSTSTRPSFLENCLALTPGVGGEKLARRERECRRREAASAHITLAQDLEEKAKLRATRYSPETATPTRLTGLVSDPQGPIGTNQTFHATGHWVGEVEGQWYLIYAGAKASPDTNQDTRSELLVYKEPAEVGVGDEHIFVGAYVPPAGGTEPLTITSASESTLSLRTSTGATLSFNVVQRAFK